MLEGSSNDKKKQKLSLLIGIVTLLVLVLGATYAYFQINTNNESSNTNITGSTPTNSLVTLKSGTDNLHLNLSAGDMAQANATKEYYATDVKDKSYEENEENGTKTIAEIELTGGEETTKYSCTAKLTVSKVTDPEAVADTIIDALKPEDMILQFKGNLINEKLDLSELKDNNPKEYDLSFNITANKVEEIQAYIKLVNKNENQNYLADKKLNIDIKTRDLKCEIKLPDPKIAELRAKDSQGYLSKDIQGGMYRYQASFPASDSSEMTNWICFGTNSKEACTNPDTGIDKYMYRIIGITEEGQLYLLKETLLQEGALTGFSWNSKFLTVGSYAYTCDGYTCPEWSNSDLFKRINGTSNGQTPGQGSCDPSCDGADTDIFVDSSQYDYLKSGDVNGGETASEWYNLIEDHNWMYGDTADTYYNGDKMYAIETGKEATNYYIQQSLGSSTVIESQYKWPETNTITAKISLMYVHDIMYSYYDGTQEETRGNPENSTNVKNSWIHFLKDGLNSSSVYEWLGTRWGIVDSSSYWNVSARGVRSDDSQYLSSLLKYGNGVRPVFYLKANVKIASGDGTKTNPYILDVQE